MEYDGPFPSYNEPSEPAKWYHYLACGILGLIDVAIILFLCLRS